MFMFMLAGLGFDGSWLVSKDLFKNPRICTRPQDLYKDPRMCVRITEVKVQKSCVAACCQTVGDLTESLFSIGGYLFASLCMNYNK